MKNNKDDIKLICIELLKYVLASMALLFLWSGYSDAIDDFVDTHIIPVTSLFIPNFWSGLLLVAIIIYCMLHIRSLYIRRYRCNSWLMFSMIWMVAFIIWYRARGIYDYFYIFCHIAYVDGLSVIGISYICVTCINYVRRVCQKQTIIEDTQQLLTDKPIESVQDDIMDLKNEVKKLSERIQKLNVDNTWSIAITAPWGRGKTSFLNMLKKELEKFSDVLWYNPRDSRSALQIQEDFFTMLASHLSKYDSRCSSLLKDYMSSLLLIDNKGVVEKFLNLYKIWDKKSLKEKIKESFSELLRPVIVVIDDFDRLSRQEILEILKLIDSNAAFNNLLFLTAYDKGQVNKTLGEEYQTMEACFVDKFFNIEYTLPSRPYIYIQKYIENLFVEKLKANKQEKNEIKSAIDNGSRFLKEYVPTLRDAKRFVNQILVDYEYVRGDVFFYEFMLLHLIRYKYQEEYEQLFKKKYLQSSGIFIETGVLYLKKDATPKSLPILQILFPQEKEHRPSTYRHIYSTDSFSNYFVNQIYSSLRLADMNALYNCPHQEIISQINNWMQDKNASNDFVKFLDSFDMDNFSNGSFFLRYAEMVAYTAVFAPDSRAYWLLRKLIFASNLDGYDKKYNLNIDEYKRSILNIISDDSYDIYLTVLRLIYISYKDGRNDEESDIMDCQELWSILKMNYYNLLGKINIGESDKLKLLYKCIDYIEPDSRRCVLDKDCCSWYREHIEQQPEFYIKNFVMLSMQSSSDDFNGIVCEPFWNQIFKDDKDLQQYIARCKVLGLPGSLCANNFWPIFVANDYKSIEFSGQGSVKEKINKDLVNEWKYLNDLKTIRQALDKIPTPNGLSAEEKLNQFKLIEEQEEKLLANKLYIKLRGDLIVKVKELKEKYKIK